MEGMARVVSAMEETTMHEGAEIFKYIYHFANTMALKCAVELRIADIIHSHGHPITLPQIASAINSPTLNADYLERIMRMLVRMKIFTSTTQSDSGDHTLYGLTSFSEFLLHDAEHSFAPFLLFVTQPMIFAPWQLLSRSVKEGGNGFKTAHGHEFYEMLPTNPEIGKLFDDAMRCLTKNIMQDIVSSRREVFSNIGSLVDVGGGTGQTMAEIVEAFPYIKAINFDLPNVVATAPEYDGVLHVAGDMFEDIPNADAIFIKHVLHNWGDEDCVKILKNCRKSIIGGKTKKIIIVDPILKEAAGGLFGTADVAVDLMMINLSSGGKERSEVEWKKLLEEGGFSHYKITELSIYATSIIEAYTEWLQG